MTDQTNQCEHRMTYANSYGQWCRSCGEVIWGTRPMLDVLARKQWEIVTQLELDRAADDRDWDTIASELGFGMRATREEIVKRIRALKEASRDLLDFQPEYSESCAAFGRMKRLKELLR